MREQVDLLQEIYFLVEVPTLHFHDDLLQCVVFDISDSAVLEALD